MPRTYHRKTNNGLVPPDIMLQAIKEIVENGKSIRRVSEELDIKKCTLQRYVAKYNQDQKSMTTPNYLHKQIFSKEQEHNPTEYLKKYPKCSMV